MPLFLRKSLSRGPVRLNLSKGGLGLSFGVKGLRLGVGPRGTYVAGGRDGLYYRQYLGQSRRNAAPAVDRPAQTDLDQALISAETFDPQALTVNDDEVAAEINRRLHAFAWGRFLWVAAVLCALGLGLSQIRWLALVLAIAFAVWAVVQGRRDAVARRITFTYDLNEEEAKRYAESIQLFRVAAQSYAIWRVVKRSENTDTKYSAGAQTSVQRIPTRITLDDPRVLCNVPTAWVWLGFGSLCCLPDRLLFFGASVISLDYGEAQIHTSPLDFREDGIVPPDSLNVGTTWQYVNKSGGPDRRFSSNRQIPIQRYSELAFQHPRLSFQLEFSREAGAESLAQGLRATTSVPPKSGGVHDLAHISDLLTNLRQSAQVATIPFTIHLTGPATKIAEFLNALSVSLESEVKRGGLSISEARGAKPRAPSVEVSFMEAFALSREVLDDTANAVQGVASSVKASDLATGQQFPQKIATFFCDLATIERRLNEAMLPAAFDSARSGFATMINEMLDDAQKWPAMLSDQAKVLGDSGECTIKLILTLDVRVYANAMADSVDAARSGAL